MPIRWWFSIAITHTHKYFLQLPAMDDLAIQTYINISYIYIYWYIVYIYIYILKLPVHSILFPLSLPLDRIRKSLIHRITKEQAPEAPGCNPFGHQRLSLNDLRPVYYCYLVGGFPGTWLDYFTRNIGNFIIPTDFHIFQRSWKHQPVMIRTYYTMIVVCSRWYPIFSVIKVYA